MINLLDGILKAKRLLMQLAFVSALSACGGDGDAQRVGTFNTTQLSGSVILSKKYISVQFHKNRDLAISKVDFQISTIASIKIEWICAMTKDRQVVRCSTEPAIFEEQNLFVDGDAYSVRLYFLDEIENKGVDEIKLIVKTNIGESTITVDLK